MRNAESKPKGRKCPKPRKRRLTTHSLLSKLWATTTPIQHPKSAPPVEPMQRAKRNEMEKTLTIEKHRIYPEKLEKFCFAAEFFAKTMGLDVKVERPTPEHHGSISFIIKNGYFIPDWNETWIIHIRPHEWGGWEIEGKIPAPGIREELAMDIARANFRSAKRKAEWIPPENF